MQELNRSEWVQHYQNPFIEKICFQSDGFCTICFRNGTTARHFVNCEIVYQSQFGVPVSPDGSLLFISSWERGLTAFDTRSGELVWKYRRSRVGRVFTYSDFLLVHRYGMGITKLEIHTGMVLFEINSSTLEHCFCLDSKLLLLDRVRGKLNVLDAATMEVVKSYSPKIFNPNNCLSLCITGAYLQNGKIGIEGFEDYPNRNHKASNPTTFYRVIEDNFEY